MFIGLIYESVCAHWREEVVREGVAEDVLAVNLEGDAERLDNVCTLVVENILHAPVDGLQGERDSLYQLRTNG